MKITSTKKLIIILLTLICALAVGLGVMWSAAETPSALSATAASAASAEDGAEPDEAELPEEEFEEKEYEEYDPAYDEGELRIIADILGHDYKIVNFYAHAFGKSVDDIYEMLKAEPEDSEEELYPDEAAFEGEEDPGEMTNAQAGAQQISNLMQSYAERKWYVDEAYEDEDWFISPDEANTYATYYVAYALPINSLNSYLSFAKNGEPITATTETNLWGSTAYALGHYNQFIGGGKRLGDQRLFHYWFVWLDPGDEFTLGIRNYANRNQVIVGAQDAPSFFDTYLTYTNPAFYRGYGSYSYWFNNPNISYTDPNWNADVADGTNWISKDPYKRSLKWYREEYHSDIAPSTAFLSKSTTTTANGGWSYLRISGDAPSGVYYLRHYLPYNTGNGAFFGGNAQNWTTSDSNMIFGGYSPFSTTWVYTTQCSYYFQFKVIVKRSSIEQPVMKFDDGVSSSRDKREVTYNGEDQTMVFEKDWGPGRITYKLYQFSDETNKWYRYDDINKIWYEQDGNTVGTDKYKWVPASNNWQEYDPTTKKWVTAAVQPDPLPFTKPGIWLVSRPTIGSGKQGDMTVAAQECGKYKVTLAPFNLWKLDGTNTVLERDFIINKIEMRRPELI